MTYAALNENIDYPLEQQLRTLASINNSYVVAVLDCSRKEIPAAQREGVMHADLIEDEDHEMNFVLTFGSKPSSAGTPVKKPFAVNYFKHLRE